MSRAARRKMNLQDQGDRFELGGAAVARRKER